MTRLHFCAFHFSIVFPNYHISQLFSRFFRLFPTSQIISQLFPRLFLLTSQRMAVADYPALHLVWLAAQVGYARLCFIRKMNYYYEVILSTQQAVRRPGNVNLSMKHLFSISNILLYIIILCNCNLNLVLSQNSI